MQARQLQPCHCKTAALQRQSSAQVTLHKLAALHIVTTHQLAELEAARQAAALVVLVTQRRGGGGDVVVRPVAQRPREGPRADEVIDRRHLDVVRPHLPSSEKTLTVLMRSAAARHWH